MSSSLVYPLSLPASLGTEYVEKNRELKDVRIIDLSECGRKQSRTLSGTGKHGRSVDTDTPSDVIIDRTEDVNPVEKPDPADAQIVVTLSSAQKQIVESFMEKAYSESVDVLKSKSVDAVKSSPPAPGMFIDDGGAQNEPPISVKSYTLVQLRELCKTHNLSTSGNKKDLFKRLVDEKVV